MSDIDRLLAWCKERDMDLHQLAKAMGLTYINVYHTVKARPKRNQCDRVNGNFIVRFIVAFGYTEAAAIFKELPENERA